MTSVGVKPALSLLTAFYFFTQSRQGNTLKYSSPSCKSSLCSLPFLSSAATIMEVSTSFPYLDFPSSASKCISSIPPPPQSVCPQSPWCCQCSHHPPCLLSFSCTCRHIPSLGSSPGSLSRHLAARHCHLQRASPTVTTAREMGSIAIWLLDF